MKLLLALTVLVSSCASTSSTLVIVSKACAVTAGKAVLPTAILEVENALALVTVSTALAALTSIAAKFGEAFVTCAVQEIVRESATNYARSDGTDAIAARKDLNGSAWLAQHAVRAP